MTHFNYASASGSTEAKALRSTSWPSILIMGTTLLTSFAAGQVPGRPGIPDSKIEREVKCISGLSETYHD